MDKILFINYPSEINIKKVRIIIKLTQIPTTRYFRQGMVATLIFVTFISDLRSIK